MPELAHVVFYVRDLARSLAFYRDVVGLGVVGTIFGGRGALLTGGRTHHELLLIQVGEAPGPLGGRRIGLYHVGWKVGEDLDALRRARDRILAAGHAIEGTVEEIARKRGSGLPLAPELRAARSEAGEQTSGGGAP